MSPKQVLVAALIAAVAASVAGCGSPTAAPPSSPTPASTIVPDEPRLLFEWFLPNHSRKSQFLAPADASYSFVITDEVAPESEHIHSDWSPDGSQIAFEAMADDGASSIWISDSDGTTAVETITCQSEGCLQQAYPAWSPDGTSIVFIQGDGTNGNWGPASIVVIRLDSGQRTVLAATPDGMSAYYSPRWSPDGTRIIAQYETYPDLAESEISSSEIVIMPADGSAPPVSLTEPELFAGHPDWSPDGSTIAFDTFDLSAFFPTSPGDSNIYLMNPDGSNLRQVTTTTLEDLVRIGEPAWTPDGDRIVATRTPLAASGKSITNAFIVFVDPDSGEITETGLQGAQVHLQPEGAS